jgi:hypothetical protein
LTSDGEKVVELIDQENEEAQNDLLTYDGIFFSVLTGKIIEDYHDDKPYPSCLVYGNIFNGNPFIVYGHSIKKQIGQY